MRVGISNDKYPEKRTIIVNPECEYINYKKRNLFFWLNAVQTRLLKKNKQFLFKPLPLPDNKKVDVFHLFNEVALTRQNWVATFETELPRILPPASGNKRENLPRLLRLAPALMEKNCLALIAISDATLNIQKKLFGDNTSLARAILEKTVVLHPPQELYVTQRSALEPGAAIHFVFVGRDFYHKGGGEIVRAFGELLDEGELTPDQVKVTLIGDLNKKYNYAFGPHQDDAAFSRKIESALAERPIFEHINALPNEEVMQLLQRADVGLLPSWAETYGFSVLEMQACGCPVITTNVRALPEINPERAGWQIVNALTPDREYAITSVQQREWLRQQIVRQLKAHILAVVNDPQQITQKANAAIERIKAEHDPIAYQQRLQALYTPQT